MVKNQKVKAKSEKFSSRSRVKSSSPKKSLEKKNLVRVFVAGGSRNGNNPIYVKQAYELGKEIGKHDYQLTFGLSSRGIMGAVAKGVLESWNQKPHKKHKPIEGVTTTDYLKRYDTEKELAAIADIVVSKTLEERKRHMLEAEFVIFTPGGVGTLDELAFDCVAMQDGLLQKKPFVLFNTDGFFHHLLEFLKDIHLKGFADFVPFIVVDNVYEASVAFDMIRYRYSLKKSKNINMEETIERIEYDLPYVLQEKQKNPQKTTRQILNEIKHTFSGQGDAVKYALTQAIETAYLKKETGRMHDRLEKTGRDMALVNHKLASLKQRKNKG